jgi:hypothetical protein
VALRGGLGNQLFQFSYALYLARQSPGVRLDLSCVRHGVPAIFDVPLIGNQARQMALPVTRFMPSPLGRLARLGRLSRQAMGPGQIILDDSAQGPKPSPGLRPAWWFGYWQRLSYAEAVIPLLRKGLLRMDPVLTGPAESAEQDRTSIARVHVRRGDYAGNAMALSTDWYKRALDIVYAVGGHQIETEVVTNDPDWCRRNLDLGRRYKILPTGSALGDMRSLARSDFVVISRSTFSWWAAAISEATVVAPDCWLPESSGEGTDDLLPSTWLSCPTRPT